MKKLFSLIILSAIFSNAFPWGNDIMIQPQSPVGKISMAAKTNGQLYAGVPVSGGAIEAVLFFTSADNGDTWNAAPVTLASQFSPITKSMMVRTGMDSIYCIYISANTIYLMNPESGTEGVFTTTGADDFAASASPGSNAIYLFVDEPGNNNLKRYGTLDGGITWTGNTATVTSNGANPATYMQGTRLFLNYRGPVLADTTASVIRAAHYNETAPGNISPVSASFQDLVTNTSVRKKEFVTAAVANTVWFFFTEGDADQVVKCRTSTDGGSTYAAEFTVAGTPAVSAYHLSAVHYDGLASSGCYLTYFSDSISPVAVPNPLMFTGSSSLSPSTFTNPTPFSDFTVSEINTHRPVITAFNGSMGPDAGVIFVEDAFPGPSVFFDRLSLITSVSDIQSESLFSVYPNPANDKIELQINQGIAGDYAIELFNSLGKSVSKFLLNSTAENTLIDISDLAPGMYFVSVQSEGNQSVRTFIKE